MGYYQHGKSQDNINNYKRGHRSSSMTFSDYDHKSLSPPPPPFHLRGDGKRRRYADSDTSSDYDSSSNDDDNNNNNDDDDDDEEKDTNISRNGNVAFVKGKRLDLSKKRKILQRDCQFVKKIIDDPVLQGTINGGTFNNNQINEKPSYLTGDMLQIADFALDPRIPCQVYFEQQNNNLYEEEYENVQFLWDSKTSKGKLPACELLITGLNVNSKALLLNLIEAATSQELASSIKDITLGNQCAYLSVKDPTACSKLLKSIDKKMIGSDIWRVKFDPGGDHFKSRSNVKQPSVEPKQTADFKISNDCRSFPQQQLQQLQYLSCSRRVSCVLVSYKDVSQDESKQVIDTIFKKCRVYNIERGGECWHVHLKSQTEIDFAKRWRDKDFRWNDKIISFTIKDFDQPALALDQRQTAPLLKDQNNYHRERNGSNNNNNNHHYESLLQNNNSTHLTTRSSSTTTTTTTSSSSLQPAPTLSNLDAFYRPSSNIVEIKSSTLNTIEAVIKDNVDVATSSSLPIFNRRYLERKQAKDQAAAQQAAEIEHLVLEERAKEKEEKEKKELIHLQEIKQQCPSTRENIKSGEKDPDLFKQEERKEIDCVKTRGFYKQESFEKKVHVEDFANVLAGPIFDQSSTQTSLEMSTASSRSARAQNRRLQSSFDNYGGGSDLFGRTSAFTARKKNLILGRSLIHSWGLFAGESVEMGDMVVEYIGEIIRHSIANVRERKYEMELQAKGSTEMASSYFFRLDDELVVDATHKGNLSRFVNHSCDPSCIARVMLISGSKRIIMYARKDIKKGEEITYDYKFPLEDDPVKKIKCLCGAKNCRGSLN